MKRMTLLAKKEGMSTSDFRAYWAGPHAQLALCMGGISEYVQNRVDKVLWASGTGEPVFCVDGVVELSFSDSDAMQLAQASAVGKKFIPTDEPQFLKGWTLCIVDTVGVEPKEHCVKVLIPFHATESARDVLWREIQGFCKESGIQVTLNWTVSTAKRASLWTESEPPSGFLGVWFCDAAAAHEAFEPLARLPCILESYAESSAAYLINQLRLR